MVQQATLQKKSHKEGKKPGKDDAYYFDLFKKKRLMIAKVIHVVTLLSVLLFASFGYGLDLVFGTEPLFLIVLLVVSFPVTQIVILKHVRAKVLPTQ